MQEKSVGYEAQKMKGVLLLKRPIEYGIVTHWDGMEKVWDYTFNKKLEISSSEHPVLLTEPPTNPQVNKEKMAQTMFETFHVPAMYIANQGALALFATGRTNGIALNSGDDVTHAIPVNEGFAVPDAVTSIKLGDRDVVDYLAKVLTEKALGWNFRREHDVVRDILEKHCYVAMDTEKEVTTVSSSLSPDISYELPDGHEIKIANERFMCPEALFKPSLMGLECSGIHSSIYDSIMKCSSDIQNKLFANIVLSGGSTMYPGLDERMQNEIVSLAPNAADTKIVCPPTRRYSVWIGGSILASMSTFQQMWISRAEYDEHGPSIVHKKA